MSSTFANWSSPLKTKDKNKLNNRKKSAINDFKTVVLGYNYTTLFMSVSYNKLFKMGLMISP